VSVGNKTWSAREDKFPTLSLLPHFQSTLPIHIQTMPKPWYVPYSDNPYAPQIMRYEYITEKATLVGSLIGSILYGTTAHTFLYSYYSLRLFGLF